jgi:hypothetical protein
MLLLLMLIDIELLLKEMYRENEGNANNLDFYLMVFSMNRRPSTWTSAHSPIQVACSKILRIVTTATTAAKYLTILGAILQSLDELAWKIGIK